MSEARLARTRRTLPQGYQFGDAALSVSFFEREALLRSYLEPIAKALWDAHDQALAAHMECPWNVIEGDHGA